MSDKSMADCKQRDCNYAMRAGCAPRLLTLFKFSKYQLIILEANDSSLEYLYLLDHPVERGLVGNFHEGHSPSIATRNPIRVTHCPARGYHSQPSKGRTHNPARVFSRSASIDYHSGGAAAPQRGAGLLPTHSGSLSSTEKGGVYVATRHRPNTRQHSPNTLIHITIHLHVYIKLTPDTSRPNIPY